MLFLKMKFKYVNIFVTYIFNKLHYNHIYIYDIIYEPRNGFFLLLTWVQWDRAFSNSQPRHFCSVHAFNQLMFGDVSVVYGRRRMDFLSKNLHYKLVRLDQIQSLKREVQSVLIICRFCICYFAYCLKCICNLKSILMYSFTEMPRAGKILNCLMYMFPSEGRNALTNHFSSYCKQMSFSWSVASCFSHLYW